MSTETTTNTKRSRTPKAQPGDVDRGVVAKVRSVMLKMAPKMTPSEMRMRIIELCNGKKYDPIASLIDMVQNDALEPDTKVAIHRELAQYVAPKIKAIEVTGDVDLNINITVKKFDDSGRVMPGVAAKPFQQHLRKAIDVEAKSGD